MVVENGGSANCLFSRFTALPILKIHGSWLQEQMITKSSYTPQVGLSAIIISAMLGLIKYKKVYHLFKTDKFDFLICISAFFGVAFISMDMGLMISVSCSIWPGFT
ncbi:hypothetical protein ACS0TY_030611 [Phlomoides rotata]